MPIVQTLRKVKRKVARHFDTRDPEACGPTGLATRWIGSADYAEKFGTT